VKVFYIGIFHEINHPASLGYPHDYGNLHMLPRIFNVGKSINAINHPHRLLKLRMKINSLHPHGDLKQIVQTYPVPLSKRCTT